MYSWDEDTSSWYGSGSYAYKKDETGRRARAAARAKAAGPRTYGGRSGPNEKVVEATKRVKSESKNPMIVAVDVTGSMASWPAEIFDRLPLFYNTLSQYRPDLEVCFAAVGDAACDRWPLQVTSFASGFDLEQLLGSLYGEGGGGDAPESYGLLAHWIDTHVEVPNAEEPPFLIVYGDITMHPKVPKGQIAEYLGDRVKGDVDAIEVWRRVARTWNVWFLRRPGGGGHDPVDKQWGKAIGEQKIIHIKDEQRAVDYAMGLVARAWDHFEDFQENMRARHSEDKVRALSEPIAMKCPRCGGPVPPTASGMFSCGYCGMTLRI